MQTLRINNNQSAVLLMSLVDGHCVLLEPIGWLCPQSDCPPSVAELFRLPPLKSGTLHRNISSRLSRCSLSGVTWKRIHYNNLSAYNTLVDLVVALVTLAILKIRLIYVNINRWVTALLLRINGRIMESRKSQLYIQNNTDVVMTTVVTAAMLEV